MIRPMELGDLEEVTAIARDLFSDAWSKEQFIYELNENPYSEFFCVEDKGEIYGFVGLNVLFERAEISIIATKREKQGQGIGYRLLKKAIYEALKKECEILSLEVRTSNKKALKLYERNGFEVMRIRESYYSDNFEDAYEMAKAIGGLDAEDFSD